MLPDLVSRIAPSVVKRFEYADRTVNEEFRAISKAPAGPTEFELRFKEHRVRLWANPASPESPTELDEMSRSVRKGFDNSAIAPSSPMLQSFASSRVRVRLLDR